MDGYDLFNNKKGIKTISFCIQEPLLDLLETVQNDRGDINRSATIRLLIIRALADLSYLPEDTKKALGLVKS